MSIVLGGPICQLPKERGGCYNYTIKWYYDSEEGSCRRFWYSGCDGNDNRFDNNKDCMESCMASEGQGQCKSSKVAMATHIYVTSSPPVI